MPDALDERIVAALVRDGRPSLRSLAADADTDQPTVRGRIRSLEDDGVLGGVTARLDYDELGYETVLVRLAVDLAAVDTVTTRLRELPGFVTVYGTTGESAVLAVGKFEEEADLAISLCELYDKPDVHRVDVGRVQSVVCEGACPLGEERLFFHVSYPRLKSLACPRPVGGDVIAVARPAPGDTLALIIGGSSPDFGAG